MMRRVFVDNIIASEFVSFTEAGTKLGPDQLGSLDPGRINSDQPGCTRINPDRPKFEHNKRKGMLNKRKRILLRIYGLTVMKIKQSLLSCAVLSSRHFVFLVPGPGRSSLRCPVSSHVLGHVLLSSAQYGWRRR